MLAGKRVVIVLPTLELGGAERQALLLGEHLRHHSQAEVQIWGLENSGGRVVSRCAELGISTRYYPFRVYPDHGFRREWIGELLAFARAMRCEQPDVLLPYCRLPNLICGAVWWLTGARTCIWNQRDAGFRVYPALERWAVRLAPGFVANGSSGAAFLARTFGLKEDSIAVVFNGVRPGRASKDREGWRQDMGLDESTFAATMIANLRSEKDHATLLHSWRIVLDRLTPGIKPILLLAGYFGSATRELKTLASELDLGDHVRFLGQIDDIAGLLAASDIAVFSSDSEGCPNGVLEPMAAALPVVASDIPGTRDALGKEAAHWLVPPGDPAPLAERIIALARDPAERRRVGQRNQERIKQFFKPEQMATQMTSVVAQKLAAPALRSRLLRAGRMIPLGRRRQEHLDRCGKQDASGFSQKAAQGPSEQLVD